MCSQSKDLDLTRKLEGGHLSRELGTPVPDERRLYPEKKPCDFAGTPPLC